MSMPDAPERSPRAAAEAGGIEGYADALALLQAVPDGTTREHATAVTADPAEDLLAELRQQRAAIRVLTAESRARALLEGND